MKIFRICLFCLSLFFVFNACLGQGLVNVDPLTGSANVSIPIYTVSNGQVAVPISLAYRGSGIKVKDVEGTGGMGWQLLAGGQISRLVRGLPDDCSQDNTGAAVQGWMSTSNAGASYASSYTILNDGIHCSNGTTDISNINANIPLSNDTEPDMFLVSAPGLSCQMVYDRAGSSPAFHPVNYQDLKITYTATGGTGNNPTSIASFAITNNKGITYTFATVETAIDSAFASATPTYFTTKYNQYKNGITYNDCWYLTSIADANGNGISISYKPAQPRIGVNPIELYLAGSTTPTLEYKFYSSSTPRVVSSISTYNVNSTVTAQYFTFSWGNTYSSGQSYQPILLSVSGMNRTMQLGYNAVTSPSGYYRMFLSTVTDVGCGTPISYQFNYYGISNNTTLLPDSSSTQVDYWGYYSSSASTSTLLPSVYVNPSTAGYPRYAIAAPSSPGSAYSYSLLTAANRAVTPSTIIYGSLSTIINEQGGNTTITYEPNDYYDVPSGTVVQGGGVRVKQTVESTGSGATNDITVNYSYLNPSGVTNSGLSSGEPATLPQFAFTIPYSGSATGQSLWTNATALSAYDLSTEDETIMYAYSSASQTGAGSQLSSFYVPATYWSASAGPACFGCSSTEWSPTLNFVSGSNCTSSFGPLANLNYSYPFVPNPNYNFERGLPLKTVTYNNSNVEVSESDYTYLRSFVPTVINAFKYDNMGPSLLNAMSYGKYLVYYNTSELNRTLTKQVFDSNTLSQAQTSTTSYAYNSSFHKLLTQQTTTNSDNSIVNSFFKYVKDFAPNSGATNPNINALYNLQQRNINAPVETYQQVTRGATTITTTALLTLYSPYTTGSITNYLPSQQRKMIVPDGSATFAPFIINTSAQTISPDPEYMITNYYDQYDANGNLQTTRDNAKRINTIFFDQLTQHPTAIFKNANYNEVAFNDFDSQFAIPTSSFSVTGTGSYTPVGSHAGNAAGVAAATQSVTTGVITKNTAAQYYIFSIWINPAAAGSLTFSGASPNPPALIYAGTGWAYHEIKIPAGSLSSAFTLSFTSSQNISIDDVLLYPDVCEVSSATFDAVQHNKIAETNTNGVSAYYANDQWGRVLYAYDQDKNIVLRKQYESAQNVQNFIAPVISLFAQGGNTVSALIPTTFSNNAFNCQPLTYVWDFGDGSSPETRTDNLPVTHNYSTTGTYTITVSATSTTMGTKTGTFSVKVIPLTTTTVHYTNLCQGGGTNPARINSIDFMQGSTLVYHWVISPPGAYQASTKIAPGTYTMVVHHQGNQYSYPSNVNGWNSIQYGAQCFGYQRDAINITMDTTNSPDVSISISPATCH